MTPNRLANETSPYLLQHAHNPVDWYPWGEEAFARARDEDKPIFLSVGYSACHWCHVMEHESFEDEETAALMNKHYVNVKVDREERPDVDEIYMNAVQMMTQQGGWPMSVFMTPDGKPFYGGTYFPPDSRYGRPGFRQVLMSVADFYKSKRSEVDRAIKGLMEGLDRIAKLPGNDAELDEDLISQAASTLAQSFDDRDGGFGSQPKFPNSMSLEVFLRNYAHTGQPEDLYRVTMTLERMAHGGVYDQLGGGFHRYSVDHKWLVPHFEKMLYDNALLAKIYFQAYQVTQEGLFLRIGTEILDYVTREMTSEAGGFFSTQDADTEGEEGLFYFWTPGEVTEVLGSEYADVFCEAYDIHDIGNFEGKSIPNLPVDLDTLSAQFGMPRGELDEILKAGREKLLAARAGRVAPGKDEKVQVSWNGLMMTAFALGYQVTGNRVWLDTALSASRFVMDHMTQSDGRLFHTYKDGRAQLNGYLDDYACLINALIDLYESCFKSDLLLQAEHLADTMIAQFWDEAGDAFFYTGVDHEKLIVRSKNPYDNGTPSGNSMSVLGLSRLGTLLRRDEYLEKAKLTLRRFQLYIQEAPNGFAQMVCAADYHLSGPSEVTISSGDGHDELALKVRRAWIPNRILASGPAEAIPMTRERLDVDGQAAVYVCKDQACSAPATLGADLDSILGSVVG